MSVLAVTGGTGFVGGKLIDLALAAGHQVRALTRRPQPARDGVEWIEGALNAPGELMRGADTAIHVAGVVNAPDRAGFAAGNIAGTSAIVAAATAASVRRFIHVSSLTAREPGLSIYGWSKAEAERVVEDSDLDWTIVRPPGVYGPGDMEMRDMFRLAKRGIALLPPPGKISIIHVEDLARLLLALTAENPGRVILEADDGVAGGWTHDGFARAIGAAVGQRVLPLALPKGLLSFAARGDRLFRGGKAKLTRDRVDYLSYPDWTVDPAKRPAPGLWQPRIPTPQGLAATAAWYRAHSLL
ncbi:NAD(P)H-binding protein [Sphingomonas sp. So64.6b]|uniref:SDR family oxidoreductase n=1 Tax=Sphingomonas sp. So64.6b TaxID=2997354 RepID=UPI0016008014|nr:NAD(P)H-binding protein [Sphingomonas sp. So64.6b]QNA83155.1 NAD(P)H-binding protein [Sphingomonas sp. So64.6b]